MLSGEVFFVWMVRGVRKERRMSARLPIPLELRAKCSNLPVINAESLDVSIGGIRLFLPEQLPKGTMMELKINLPIPLAIARGQVVWGEWVETKEGKFFQTGIQLSDGFISVYYAKIRAFLCNIMRAYRQESGLAFLQGLFTALAVSLVIWALIITFAWIVF
jgi:hypothetical protein